ncbi:GNAT family N-acetyltransferase [Neobacillus pocheonensis]|uniref:GNAT family N-acetyltransferase n=1 Tax=Neobacillus pocheonensis TaxID=363869 RepID=A0ABT0W7D4_9BACI|nr:GNAT family N-acetyltransferase [Neobacillus pocheonensis]
MLKQIVVREALPEDKESVQKLLLGSYQQYESDYKNPQVWSDYLENIRSSVYNEQVDKILIAESDGEILGSLQLFQSSEKAYNRPELQIHSPIVRLLGVHPKARGRGVAQALLKASVEYAQTQGAIALYLHSSDKMHQAIKLYKWLGFNRDLSKEFYNHDILVKCFRLDLQASSLNKENFFIKTKLTNGDSINIIKNK